MRHAASLPVMVILPIIRLITQYDGVLTRAQAEDLAAQRQGFADAASYWAWLAAYVLARKVPG